MQHSPPIGGYFVDLLPARNALAGRIDLLHWPAGTEPFVCHQPKMDGRTQSDHSMLHQRSPLRGALFPRPGPDGHYRQLQSAVLLAPMLLAGAEGKAAAAHHRAPQLDAGKFFFCFICCCAVLYISPGITRLSFIAFAGREDGF